MTFDSEAREVYPLQSGSVASKRTKCASGDLDLLETCPGLESHSPLRSPDADVIGHNLLAIRVTVTSDGSSSEAETERSADPSNREAMVTSSPGASPSGLAMVSRRQTHAHAPQSKEEAKPAQSNWSKAQEALRRAHSFNAPAVNRQEKWRKKIQIKLPLLLRKKMEPAMRETSLNGANGTEDKNPIAQVPSGHSPSDLRRGYSLPNRSSWQHRAVKNPDLAVAVPRPHPTGKTDAPLAHTELQQPQAPHPTRTIHKLSIWCNDGSERGEEVTSDSHPGANLMAQGEDAPTPETFPSSEHQGTDCASRSKLASTDAVGMAESTLQRLLFMDRQSRGSVKQLIDSPGQPTQSLDRNYSVTSNATMEKEQETEEAKGEEDNVGEVHPTKCDRKTPSEPKTKSSGSSLLTQPISPTNSDMHSPTEYPKMEGASFSGHTPGNDSPKSPLSYLVNAFRRSFFDSKDSVFSDGVEQTQEKKPKMRRAKPFSTSSFHGLSLSVFNSSTQHTSTSEDGGQHSSAMQHSPVPNQHRVLSSVPRYRPDLGVFHKSSRFDNSTGDSSKVSRNENQHLNRTGQEKDRRPNSWENLSLKQGNLGQIKSELNLHIRRRLGSTKAENNKKPASAMEDTMATASKNDIWRLMASFKKKSFRERVMKEPLPRACSSTSSSTLHNAKGLNILPAPKALKVVTQLTEGESETSSDEPSEENLSLRQREGQNFRRQRKMRNLALQQAKQEEVKRLHSAQIIQRQLQEVEEKQRVLEERGVLLEKALRGESEHSSNEEAQLLQKWFKLVMEKNALVRYEAEMMIFARELELEDQQSTLQQMLRDQMAVDDTRKTEQEIAEEKQILNEMLNVIEHRDKLVVLLEQLRLQEKEEDRDLESWVVAKGYKFNWS